MEKRTIERYFTKKDTLEQVITDFRFLVTMVNHSGGEYSIQLRQDYFNVYYKGNSLAMVRPYRRGQYRIKIHRDFATKEVCDALCGHCAEPPYRGKGDTGPYVYFTVAHDRLHQFLQKKHITALSRNIEERNYGEEISYEQVIITDNPPNPSFIIIDRQVADHRNKAQMDLLSLARDSVARPFHFLVIEMKLGRNRELSGEVAGQLSGYVKHVEKHIDDYVACYEENYRQNKVMGLFYERFPAEIEIEKRVEGLLVVAGYSQLAKKPLELLKKNHPDLNVQQLANRIKPPAVVGG